MASLTSSNEARGLLTVYFVTLITGAILVILRLYIRKLRRAIGSDDYVIAAALVVATFGAVLVYLEAVNGGGRHIQSLPPAKINRFLKWMLMADAQFTIQTCLVKISICLFILRITKSTRKYLTLGIYVLMAFLIAITIAILVFFFVLFARCSNLEALSNPEMHGRCFDADVLTFLGYLQAALNTLTDFICAGLPVFVLRRLQMKLRLKIALCMVMGLGVFTGGCSIGRIAFLSRAHSADITFIPYSAIIFWILEENLGTIVASLPVLRPVLDEIIDTIAKRIGLFVSYRRRNRETQRPVNAGHDTSSSRIVAPGNAASQNDLKPLEHIAFSNAENLERTYGDYVESKHGTDSVGA